MEITLSELMVLQSALRARLYFSKNPKPETFELKEQIDEAYGIIMNKIDNRDPFDGYGGPVGRV
jgi:hypothetical protein